MRTQQIKMFEIRSGSRRGKKERKVDDSPAVTSGEELNSLVWVDDIRTGCCTGCYRVALCCRREFCVKRLLCLVRLERDGADGGGKIGQHACSGALMQTPMARASAWTNLKQSARRKEDRALMARDRERRRVCQCRVLLLPVESQAVGVAWTPASSVS